MSRRDDRNGRAAIVAILVFRGQMAAARRAGDAERQAALTAELCFVAIILLASWALHELAFSRMGRLLPARFLHTVHNGCSIAEYHAIDDPVTSAGEDIFSWFVNHFTNVARPQIVGW